MTPLYLQQWRKDNSIRLSEINKKSYRKNRKKILAHQKEIWKRDKEKIKVRKNAWAKNNRPLVNKSKRKTYAKKVARKISKQKWYLKHGKERSERRKKEGYHRTPERRAAAKAWRDNNPEKVKAIERRKYLKRKAKKINAT